MHLLEFLLSWLREHRLQLAQELQRSVRILICCEITCCNIQRRRCFACTWGWHWLVAFVGLTTAVSRVRRTWALQRLLTACSLFYVSIAQRPRRLHITVHVHINLKISAFWQSSIARVKHGGVTFTQRLQVAGFWSFAEATLAEMIQDSLLLDGIPWCCQHVNSPEQIDIVRLATVQRKNSS